MHARCLFLPTTQYSSVSGHHLYEKKYHEAIQALLLLAICARSSNMKISECLGVNLRIVQRIRKKLDESNGNYEGVWSDH